MNTIEYCVSYINEGGIKKGHGVVFAESYAEAAQRLEKYYDNIVDIKLFMNDKSYIYEFEETVDRLWHGLFKIKEFSEWEQPLIDWSDKKQLESF